MKKHNLQEATDIVYTAIDATRAEARREAIGMIEQNYSRQGAIESIRALATQPAPEPSEPSHADDSRNVCSVCHQPHFAGSFVCINCERKPSEPMRSAEEWCNSLLLGRDNSDGCARPETEMRQQMSWGSWVNFIRAIQTNAASAAEPLLEEAMTALKDCVDYWPASLNDDLQEVTHEKAKAVLAKWVKA